MRTFAARQADLDADRYATQGDDKVRTKAHDPHTAKGAAAIINDRFDKTAAKRILAELWVALGKGGWLNWDTLAAPSRVIHALVTLGLVEKRVADLKVTQVKLTGQGQRMALAAVRSGKAAA